MCINFVVPCAFEVYGALVLCKSSQGFAYILDSSGHNPTTKGNHNCLTLGTTSCTLSCHRVSVVTEGNVRK